MIEESDILYRDEDYIIVNKPCNLLVHRTSTDDSETDFALQQVRDLIGQRVYPVHRLDKPTSGVLLFGLRPEAASKMSDLFLRREINKQYAALVRGWFGVEFMCLNYPVKNSQGNLLDARTDFFLSEKFELHIPVDRYPTSRYSIVKAYPKTGRWHQIRQHLAHLRHYIINDRVHGTGHHNRMFTESLGIPNMFLHAETIQFKQPVTGIDVEVVAPFPKHWDKFREIVLQNRQEYGLNENKIDE